MILRRHLLTTAAEGEVKATMISSAKEASSLSTERDEEPRGKRGRYGEDHSSLTLAGDLTRRLKSKRLGRMEVRPCRSIRPRIDDDL